LLVQKETSIVFCHLSFNVFAFDVFAQMLFSIALDYDRPGSSSSCRRRLSLSQVMLAGNLLEDTLWNNYVS
jgi:hypothetical protein